MNVSLWHEPFFISGVLTSLCMYESQTDGRTDKNCVRMCLHMNERVMK